MIRKKLAHVMIGGVQAELPLERMLWAKPARDDKTPQAYRSTPTSPSQVFKRGDVILVSCEIPVGENKSQKPLQVSLEQEPQIQGALFSMDTQTGQVMAMIGGYDFDKSEFNRATQAVRQPGSAFKPIIYASALEKGFTPASIIVDSPMVFKDLDGNNSWKPSNFESKFYGDTTFRQALIKSRNIPTVKIVQALQVPNLIQFAKRIGMNAQFAPDLSISLGSASLTLMELTKTYSLFPRMGRKITPMFFQKIVDRDGKLLEERTSKVGSSIAAIGEAATKEIPVQPTATASTVPGDLGLRGASKVSFPEYPLPGDPDQVMDPSRFLCHDPYYERSSHLWNGS